MILWLSKDGLLYGGEGYYKLNKRSPTLDEMGEWCGGKLVYGFCCGEFEKLLPSLKLRARTKCKVKSTNTKNGIKLVKCNG